MDRVCVSHVDSCLWVNYPVSVVWISKHIRPPFTPYSKSLEQMSLNLQGFQSRWKQKEIQYPSKHNTTKTPFRNWTPHLESVTQKPNTPPDSHHLRLKTSKFLLNNEKQQLTLQKNSRKFFFPPYSRLRPEQWLVNDKREEKIKEGYEEIRPSPAGSNTIA